ncbi:hypothetical protein ACWEP8_24685 [Streptomyces hydrogenans]
MADFIAIAYVAPMWSRRRSFVTVRDLGRDRVAHLNGRTVVSLEADGVTHGAHVPGDQARRVPERPATWRRAPHERVPRGPSAGFDPHEVTEGVAISSPRKRPADWPGTHQVTSPTSWPLVRPW